MPPLVSLSVGFTLHIGDPGNNEYYKMNVEVKDIDTSLDVDEQIQQAHVGFHKLAAWAEEQIGNKMKEAMQK